MRTAAICPTCATFTNAVCVLYDGDLLVNIDVAPLDSLQTALEQINTAIGVLQANTSIQTGTGAPTLSADFIGQLYINTTLGNVYAGVATGGGYADWVKLTSTPNTTTTTTTAP